jgi:RecB family exonuclease
MPKRLQSPSSINTFKQCKRKYFYQYIEKVPTLSNIHQVRGNIAHSCLEDFYDIDISSYDDSNFEAKCKEAIQRMLVFQWRKYGSRLKDLGMSKDQERFYFEETMMMLLNWTSHFLRRIRLLMKDKGFNFHRAYEHVKPIRELEYKSDNYSVRGFIDAIEHLEDEIRIIDYKTNSRSQMKDSIRLQLAIYSLLYFEKHGKVPHKVGVFFLRDQQKLIDVDDELLNLARLEIELIHAHTGDFHHVIDYPRTLTPLCKWSTGQCDFYKICNPHNDKDLEKENFKRLEEKRIAEEKAEKEKNQGQMTLGGF